ncbi:MAG TPA: hypothetical protein VN902_09925 [Candidatus Acidoferrales bacterium]|nr:hypothetical protein [Candidatus Acidoferrales bacterium]
MTLDVENISSLDVSSAGSIAASVRAQLQRHSFSLAPENSAAAQTAVRLQLSLSESAADYVWVMQILNDQRDGTAVPVMIVAAPKGNFADLGADVQSLSLEKRFVWKQAERFLDFALWKEETSTEFTLLVLGTNRLTTYKPGGSLWQLARTSPLPQATPPSRDPQGTINLKEGKISLQGFECVGDPDLAGVLQCKASTAARNLRGPLVDSPGYPISLGAIVSEKCRGELISLYTAESDWTESDSIRGYLTKGIALPRVASGNPIEFDGPVTSLKAEPGTSAARAVVHNLKTGEYEAYIVTATCGN